MKRKHVFSMIFVLCLCVTAFLTGCNGEAELETVYLNFADAGGGSRDIGQENSRYYPVSELYWTYTAKKLDGLYTEGESQKTDSANAGITAPVADTDGKYFVMKPVASSPSGPVKGLENVTVGPFATGDWQFRIYGYATYTASTGKFTDLIYSGTPSADTKVVKLASGESQSVMFTLANGTNYPTTGFLAVGPMSLVCPAGMKLCGSQTAASDVETTVKATLMKGTTVVATSTTVLSADVEAGGVVHLKPFTVVSGQEKQTGAVTFNMKVEYMDIYTKTLRADLYKTTYDTDGDGFITLGEFSNFPVTFTKGIKTTLFGDVGNIQVKNETQRYGFIVGGYAAEITKSGKTTTYPTLQDAIDAWTTGDTIVIKNDVSSVGKVSLNSKNVVIDPGSYVVGGVTWLDSTGSLTFKSTSGGSYKFSGANTTLTCFQNVANGTVIYDTLGGNVTVDAASDTVYHSGAVGTLDILNVKNNKSGNQGYFLDTSDNAITVNITKGYLNIGGGVKVSTLNSKSAVSGNVVISGRKTAVINALQFNGTAIALGTSAQLANNSFKKITLNGNGGTSTTPSGTVLYYSGVEGASVILPANTFALTVSSTSIPFKYWNTLATPIPSSPGVSYYNKSAFTVGSTDADNTLYAFWGNFERYAKKAAGITNSTGSASSTGSGAYIVISDFTETSANFSIAVEMTYKQSNSTWDYPCLCGTGNTFYICTNNGSAVSYGYKGDGSGKQGAVNTNDIHARIGDTWIGMHDVSAKDTNKHYLFHSSKRGAQSTRFGSSVTSNTTVPNSWNCRDTNPEGYNLAFSSFNLFCSNSSGSWTFVGTIGETRVWNSADVQTGETLALDLIPCTLTAAVPSSMWGANNYTGMNKAGTVGMWDVVHDKFYCSKNDKTFTAETTF